MNETDTDLVYILAHTRRGPYYIGVAKDFDAAYSAASTITDEYASTMGGSITDPADLVWYEVCESQALALTRAAAIRKWPLRWQRQLIESKNPDWWELSRLRHFFPIELWRKVPEIAPATRKPGAHDTEQP